MGSWLQPNWIHYWVTTNHVDTEKSLTQIIKATTGLEFYCILFLLFDIVRIISAKASLGNWGEVKTFLGRFLGSSELETWKYFTEMNLYCVISHIYAICSKSGKSWTFYIHTLTSRVCAWKERKFSAVCVTSLSLNCHLSDWSPHQSWHRNCLNLRDILGSQRGTVVTPS